jgi:hypothetical protein
VAVQYSFKKNNPKVYKMAKHNIHSVKNAVVITGSFENKKGKNIPTYDVIGLVYFHNGGGISMQFNRFPLIGQAVKTFPMRKQDELEILNSL